MNSNSHAAERVASPAPVPAPSSAVMPCHDAQAFLAHAVGSVLANTFPAVGPVAAADDSTDASIDVLGGYGKRLTLLQQRNRGPHPARNRGMAACRGEFVAFLDAGDWWTPECERAHKLERFFRAAAPWPIHAALLRRSVWDEVGDFDTDFAAVMDDDLWPRVDAFRQVVRVERVAALCRHDEGGRITSRQRRQAQNSWKVKRKFPAANRHAAAQHGPERVGELVDAGMLRRSRHAYVRRAVVSTQRIFLTVSCTRGWGAKALKYLLAAPMPAPLYGRPLQARDGVANANR